MHITEDQAVQALITLIGYYRQEDISQENPCESKVNSIPQMAVERMAQMNVEDRVSSDPVHHPSHYSWRGGMEAADIAAELCKGAEGDEAAWIFNLAKYVYRYPKKNGVQDIDKAIECLQRLKKVVQKKASHGNAME